MKIAEVESAPIMVEIGELSPGDVFLLGVRYGIVARNERDEPAGKGIRTVYLDDGDTVRHDRRVRVIPHAQAFLQPGMPHCP